MKQKNIAQTIKTNINIQSKEYQKNKNMEKPKWGFIQFFFILLHIPFGSAWNLAVETTACCGSS